MQRRPGAPIFSSVWSCASALVELAGRRAAPMCSLVRCEDPRRERTDAETRARAAPARAHPGARRRSRPDVSAARDRPGRRGARPPGRVKNADHGPVSTRSGPGSSECPTPGKIPAG
jgi:hypothetical protein